jgi:hypothetical protein
MKISEEVYSPENASEANVMTVPSSSGNLKLTIPIGAVYSPANLNDEDIAIPKNSSILKHGD